VATGGRPEDDPVTAHRGIAWLHVRSIALALLSCLAVAGCDVADATALDVNTSADPNTPAVVTQVLAAPVATGTTAPVSTAPNAPRATVAPATPPPPTKTPVLLLLPSPTPTKTVTPVTPVPTIAPPPPPPSTPAPTVAPTPVPTVAPTPVPGPKVAVLPSTSGTRGTTFTLQLTGWPAGRVTETVTNPAGAVIRTATITVATNGTGSGTFTTKTSDPVGAYTVRFDMGSTHLTTSITLR
jgi:outer membrane biosynthesis protein TonB